MYAGNEPKFHAKYSLYKDAVSVLTFSGEMLGWIRDEDITR